VAPRSSSSHPPAKDTAAKTVVPLDDKEGALTQAPPVLAVESTTAAVKGQTEISLLPSQPPVPTIAEAAAATGQGPRQPKQQQEPTTVSAADAEARLLGGEGEETAPAKEIPASETTPRPPAVEAAAEETTETVAAATQENLPETTAAESEHQGPQQQQRQPKPTALSAPSISSSPLPSDLKPAPPRRSVTSTTVDTEKSFNTAGTPRHCNKKAEAEGDTMATAGGEGGREGAPTDGDDPSRAVEREDGHLHRRYPPHRMPLPPVHHHPQQHLYEGGGQYPHPGDVGYHSSRGGLHPYGDPDGGSPYEVSPSVHETMPPTSPYQPVHVPRDPRYRPRGGDPHARPDPRHRAAVAVHMPRDPRYHAGAIPDPRAGSRGYPPPPRYDPYYDAEGPPSPPPPHGGVPPPYYDYYGSSSPHYDSSYYGYVAARPRERHLPPREPLQTPEDHHDGYYDNSGVVRGRETWHHRERSHPHRGDDGVGYRSPPQQEVTTADSDIAAGETEGAKGLRAIVSSSSTSTAEGASGGAPPPSKAGKEAAPDAPAATVGLGCKQSPGVVTHGGSVETHKTSHFQSPPDQPSLKSRPTDAPNSDSSWRQLQLVASVGEEEILRLQSSKSDSLVTLPGLEETKDKGVHNSGVSAATTVPNVDEPDKQDCSPGDLKAAPSGTSSLSASPTDDSGAHYFDAATNVDHHIHDYRQHPRPMHQVPYHRHYYPPTRPTYPHRHPLHDHFAAPPPSRRPVGASAVSSPSAHLHGQLAIVPQRSPHKAGGDHDSPSASTISTKASLVAAEGGAHPLSEDNRGSDSKGFFHKGHPPTPSMKPKRPFHVKKSREGEESNIHDGNNNNNDKLQHGDSKRRKLNDTPPDKATHANNTGSHPQCYRPDSKTPSPTSNLELLSDHATNASASSNLAALSHVALDGHIMPSSYPLDSAHQSSDHHSYHSAHSFELGAVPSWESAGRPLAGWGSVSSVFSFSDALRTDQGREGGSPEGGGNEMAPSGGNAGNATGGRGEHGEEGQDPSPKSILSKMGEKRKTLAPGTHVQFTSEAAAMKTTSAPRKRSNHGMRSSPGQPPYAMKDEYYYDYPSPYHPVTTQGPPYEPYPPPYSRQTGLLPPPSSSGRHPSSRDMQHHHYPEEDPYYDDYYGHPYGGPPPPHYGYSPHPRASGGRHPPSANPSEDHPPPHSASLHHHRGASSGRRRGPAPNTVHTPPIPLSFHRHHRSSSARHPHIGGGSGSSPYHYNLHHYPHHTSSDSSSGAHHHFSHRASSLGPNAPGGWSKEDDFALMEIMKKHKSPKNWDPIAKKLARDKSPRECQERWTRYLKPGSRKGQWTDEEDAIVIDAVQNAIEDPFTRWSDLAQRLPGRVGKQVRDRWVNHLNPAINHLPFSSEDDLLLWEGHQLLGKRWVEISSKYFKGTRSENHIKNRWYSASFKKFIAKELGPDAYRLSNDLDGRTRQDASVTQPVSSGDDHIPRPTVIDI